MSGQLFPIAEDSPVAGPLRSAFDGWVSGLVDGCAPGPMVEHARILADILDAENRTNRAWAGAGRPLPSGTLMAQCQLSREFRDTFAGLYRVAVGGDDDGGVGKWLAKLAEPLTRDTA